MYKVVKTPKGFLCPIDRCGKTFVSEMTVSKHIRLHLRDSNLSANISFAKYKSPGYKHQLFPCPFDGCNLTFSLQSVLNKHMRNDHSENNLVCTHEGCGRRFKVESFYLLHLQTHSNTEIKVESDSEEDPNLSQEYDSDVTSDDDYEDLASSSIRKKVKPYVCSKPGCKYRTSYKNHYENHVRVHESKSWSGIIHECDWPDCSYTSDNAQAFKAHIRRHKH